MKSHFLRAIALLLVAFYGYMASLTAHPFVHTTDYSISTNAPLFYSELNAYGWFGGEQNAGLNRVSTADCTTDFGIHIEFYLTSGKESSPLAKERTIQFGFKTFVSIPKNGSVLTAQLGKSVGNTGTVSQRHILNKQFLIDQYLFS
jgi:hypothetical protein